MSADLSLPENSTARPKGITLFAVVWAFWAVAFLLMPFLLIPKWQCFFPSPKDFKSSGYQFFITSGKGVLG